MCGINFILDKNHNLEQDTILSMNSCLSHRGPDHNDVFLHKNETGHYLFGTTRLKIVDSRDEANQPFQSTDKRYVLIFNGEIYNYRQLKNQLIKTGYVFRTESDTEVLLALLITQGIAGIKQLDGMFSFVFTDFKENRTIVARDASGIKPLYYFQDEQYLIYSSEIRGVLSSQLVTKELNEKQIAQYIRYKYARSPETFYKNIFEVAPGSYRIHQPEHLESGTFEGLQSKTPDSSFESLINKSLGDQISTNVPMGLMLSGGLDSSLLLALIKGHGFNKFPCYTIGNSAEGTSDIKYAKLLTRHFGVKHEAIEVSPKQLADNFNDYIQRIDQPIADGAGYLTWMLTKSAANDVKILLSGAGADELFAGYNRHTAYYYYLKHFWKNPLARWSLRTGGKLVLKNRHQSMFADNITADPIQTFDQFRSMRTKGLWARNTTEKREGITKDEYFKMALKLDRTEYLVNDVLKITDNLSMQNGVEVRVPYLSTDIVKYAQSLSTKELMKGEPKWILKNILKKHLPAHLYNRSKVGFGMPFGSWVRNGEVKNITEQLLNPQESIYNHLDFNEVQTLINLHISHKKDYSNELWGLSTLSHWLNKEFPV